MTELDAFIERMQKANEKTAPSIFDVRRLIKIIKTQKQTLETLSVPLGCRNDYTGEEVDKRVCEVTKQCLDDCHEIAKGRCVG